MDGGRAAGKSPFRGCGFEAGPYDGGDALRSVVLQQRLGQAGAVGDCDRVAGEQRHQPFGATRGGGGEEFLDNFTGGCRVDFAAARRPYC